MFTSYFPICKCQVFGSTWIVFGIYNLQVEVHLLRKQRNCFAIRPKKVQFQPLIETPLFAHTFQNRLNRFDPQMSRFANFWRGANFLVSWVYMWPIGGGPAPSKRVELAMQLQAEFSESGQLYSLWTWTQFIYCAFVTMHSNIVYVIEPWFEPLQKRTTV